MIKEYEFKVNLLKMMSDTDYDNDWDCLDNQVIHLFGEDVFQNKITSGYTYITTQCIDETPYLWWKFEVEEDE